MACKDLFIQKLRRNGLRVTPQRELVLEAMHSIEGFASAEEIYTHVRTIAPSIDLSTVYRTLDLLVGLQLVGVLDVGENQRRYELLGIHGLHHHLHCSRCRRTIPVPAEDFDLIKAQLKERYGFTLAAVSWTFTGLCADCEKSLDEEIWASAHVNNFSGG